MNRTKWPRGNVLTLEQAMRLALQKPVSIYRYPEGGYTVVGGEGEENKYYFTRFATSSEVREALAAAGGNSFQAGEQLLAAYEARRTKKEER